MDIAGPECFYCLLHVGKRLEWTVYSRTRQVFPRSISFRSFSYTDSLKVVQELGREGILPYSSLFASSKPFNAPLAALFLQYSINMVLMIVPPPGDAFHFLLNRK